MFMHAGRNLLTIKTLLKLFVDPALLRFLNRFMTPADINQCAKLTDVIIK